MCEFIVKRLSESLFSSRLFRINTHGTASATAIDVFFYVFFFSYKSAVLCLFFGYLKRTKLLEALPESVVSLPSLLRGRGIIHDKPCEELRAIDLVGEHGLATGLEGGSAFGGGHGDEVLYSLA